MEVAKSPGLESVPQGNLSKLLTNAKEGAIECREVRKYEVGTASVGAQIQNNFTINY
jgi:hypothetical protein